jgi:transcriptional regulator with XRE-family HTH domain
MHDDENRLPIGRRIKAVRSAMSQKEFAKRLGVAQNTIGNYERGERHPKIDVVMRIVSEFDVSYDWLVEGKGTWKDHKTAMASSEGCSQCDVLRAELKEERALNRELNAENRQLLKENGDLRVDLERMKARAAPDDHAPPEATKDCA